MKIKSFQNEIIIHPKMLGYGFRLSDEKWQLDKETCIYPHKVANKMPITMQLSYLKTLAYFASEYSSAHVKKINGIFNRWFEIMTTKTIDDKSIHQLNVHLGSKRNYELSTIKQFIIKWNDLGYCGVDISAIRMIDRIKITPNQTGDAVKRRDPNKGPLTEDEVNSILINSCKLFKDKKIKRSLYCYVNLLVKTGRRPLQLTSLKVKDLIANEQGYFLNIPKVKQRKGFRKEFNMIEVDFTLYELLSSLIDENQAAIEDKIGCCINYLKKELPIFCDLKKIHSLDNIEDFTANLKSDLFHVRNSIISKQLKDLTIDFNITSPRTGHQIELNARRFRYTLGTRLADEGAPVEVIAKALDHKSVNSSGIYVKNSPDNIGDIDKKLNSFFEPLSKIFLGEDIERNKNVFIEYVLDSFGLTDDKNDEIKCFTCKNFRPWSS